jgi:hypothetical protein
VGPQDTGRFYLICASNPLVLASEDGIKWFSLSQITKVSTVAYSTSRNIYIATGQSSIWTSSDGVNWTRVNRESINYVSQFSYLVDTPSNPTIVAVSAVDNTIAVGTN